MTDYIDRQALIDLFQRVSYDDWNQGVVTTWANAYKEAAALVEAVPPADVEPVVRCKDCEFYTEEERWCRRLGLCGAFDTNDYCSHAERREE